MVGRGRRATNPLGEVGEAVPARDQVFDCRHDPLIRIGLHFVNPHWISQSAMTVGMEEPFERLKRARLQAGYVTAADAARAFGWSIPGYSHHENGTRAIRPEVAAKYARAFRTSASWLLFGGDNAEDPPLPTRLDEVEIPEKYTSNAGPLLTFICGYTVEALRGRLSQSPDILANLEQKHGPISDWDKIEVVLTARQHLVIDFHLAETFVRLLILEKMAWMGTLDDSRVKAEALIALGIGLKFAADYDAAKLRSLLLTLGADIADAIDRSALDPSERASLQFWQEDYPKRID
jgi:transcriptional regulator with XRE-family HTH domain